MDARPPGFEKPDTSRGFRPTYAPLPEHIARSQSVLRKDGELNRFQVHPEWLSALRRRAYIANAQASSSIEGNPLTPSDAEAVVVRLEEKALRNPRPPEREIAQQYRFFRALEKAAPTGHRDLAIEEIERTHSELLDGVLPREKRLGKIRGPGNESNVYVGRLVCTPWRRVRKELEGLLTWYYGPGGALPTPIRVALWFHEFESIHPFLDGNGRVGRALTHRLLRTDGLPNALLVALDRPFNADRSAYFRALDSVRDGGHHEDWVTYFLDSLQGAYEASLLLLDRLTTIPVDVQGAPRAILEHLLRSGGEEFHVRDVVGALHPYRPITITWALSRLTARGWLQHNGKRGRASAYRPGRKLIDILGA